MHLLRMVCLCGLSLSVLGGCADNGLSSLTGQVTIDGKPAPAGISLMFQPEDIKGSPSYGQTDANGRYEAAITFKTKGIQPGIHSIQLMPSAVETPMPEIGPDGQPLPSKAQEQARQFSKLPRDYYSFIEKVTVEPGANSHDIALKTTDNPEELPPTPPQ